MFGFSYLIIFFALIYVEVFAYEYCRIEKQWCRKQQRHIACHPEQLGEMCANYTICPVTKKLRKLYLDVHNKYRNEIACGRTVDRANQSYPTASRMRELVWDDELAYLAYLHAKSCNFSHDECRSTQRFPKAGQNLGLIESSAPIDRNASTMISGKISNWYKEHLLTEASIIDEYISGFNVGHFTQMVNDKVFTVGCSLVSGIMKTGNHMKMLSCDYNYGNVIDAPTYRKGKPASDCSAYKVGKSKRYECLCGAS